jgi:hypothetical protein
MMLNSWGIVRNEGAGPRDGGGPSEGRESEATLNETSYNEIGNSFRIEEK